MPSVTSADPCACCGGKMCFQQWGAQWDCDTNSWVMTPGAKTCMTPRSVGWTGSGCGPYLIYVAMEHDCTADSDCTALDDTDPPLPPYVGKPPDCCCCVPCADLDPDPACCAPCGTPNQVRVTIVAATGSIICSFDTANSHHVHLLDVSALVGTTFTLPYAGDCVWSATFDVTALIRMLQCNGDGTGCGACTPTTDVTASTTMTISVSAGGAIAFSINLIGSDPELDNSPDGFAVVQETLFSGDYVDCCEAWSAIGPGPTGTEPFQQIFITLATVVPC